MDGVVDGAQTHRADGGQQRHAAALDDAHVVDVLAGAGMIHGVEGADDAAHGLGQGAVIERRAAVGQQAAPLHDHVRDHHVGGVAADVGEGVAGGGVGVLGLVQRGLDGELLAGLELIGPLGADFHDLAAELMADDDGVLRHVVGNTLMIGALDGRLVGRHANAVGDNMGKDLVLSDGRELKGLQTQVVLAIQTNRCRFHIIDLL